MKRLYQISYDSSVNYPTVREWADGSPIVQTWRHELPQCLFVITEADSNTLAREFRESVSRTARFLVSEVGTESAGRMTMEFWMMWRTKELPAETTVAGR